MRLLFVVLVLALGAALVTPVARAEPQSDREVLAKARKHFERGERHYRRGEYHRAADAYTRAYELTEHPELLYNMAQAYRLGGRPAEALEHYKKFLEKSPDHDAAPQARRLIAELERSLAAQEGEGGGGRKGEPEREPRSGGGGTLRLAGMITAGAGVALAGVGVKFGLDARAASSAIENHEGEPWPDELLDRQKSGKTAEQRMFLFAGLGAAAVVTGGTLYYFGAKARVAPSVTRDEVALSLVGTF